ncbi:MAG: type I-E CRISPR-associated protein Cas5/CasD [Lachnospiraceae bacterium]|nr:type I-E CRISPR-associated protein Cas5/CasD [Lachnospiraceae bacterium]
MKFQGPLQSYGTDSHFETRHTDDHPSKGAVIGLIAAALGIRREETVKLQELRNLHIIFRVDQVGQMSKEFQIAAKYKKTGDHERNYVTYRYYLEDAVFLVALEGEDDLTKRIYEALKRPYFQLFYGRRSCPVNYDFLLGLYAGAAFDQIREWPWIAADWYRKRRAGQEKIRLDVYGDAACIPEASQRALRRDQPISFSQMGRQHEQRFESHKNIWIANPDYVTPDIQTEHDAFTALMEEEYVSEQS